MYSFYMFWEIDKQGTKKNPRKENYVLYGDHFNQYGVC